MKEQRLIDANSLEKHLALGQAVIFWDDIEKAPAIKPEAQWRDAKTNPPKEDGDYFAVYKFWNWDDCVDTREFKDGKWTEEERRGEVRLWMPIPFIPKEDGGKEE